MIRRGQSNSKARHKVSQEADRSFPLAGRIAVYHLDSKVIHRAIGHPDLRFRRPHGLDYVKTKLLSLDFILRNPQKTHLATEREKVDYFIRQHSIPVSDLPAKVYRSTKRKIETVRYFVDKFPSCAGRAVAGLCRLKDAASRSLTLHFRQWSGDSALQTSFKVFD